MSGEILLPDVTLDRSGSYFHPKLERASNAITANATYCGNAQWAQEYLVTAIVTRISRADGWPLAATGPAR